MDETPIIGVLVALVILPLESMVMVGTEVAPPYTPPVTPEFDKVVENVPVPTPVTSPVKTIF